MPPQDPVPSPSSFALLVLLFSPARSLCQQTYIYVCVLEREGDHISILIDLFISSRFLVVVVVVVATVIGGTKAALLSLHDLAGLPLPLLLCNSSSIRRGNAKITPPDNRSDVDALCFFSISSFLHSLSILVCIYIFFLFPFGI